MTIQSKTDKTDKHLQKENGEISCWRIDMMLDEKLKD